MFSLLTVNKSLLSLLRLHLFFDVGIKKYLFTKIGNRVERDTFGNRHRQQNSSSISYPPGPTMNTKHRFAKIFIQFEEMRMSLISLLLCSLTYFGRRCLGDALADGVNLGVTPALHADVHVQAGDTVHPSSRMSLFVGLESEDLWLHQLDQGPVNLDQAMLVLAVGHHHHLLAIEALSRLQWCCCSWNRSRRCWRGGAVWRDMVQEMMGYVGVWLFCVGDLVLIVSCDWL